MPRPKTVDDNTVLDAALKIMLRPQREAFTLSDVATEVGLSRAALIQRFQNRDGLQLRVAERGLQMLEEYLQEAPSHQGVDDVRTFLRTLVNSMGSDDRLPSLLMMLRDDMVDKELNTIAKARNRLIRNAISERLPDASEGQNDMLASLIQATMQGAALQAGVDSPSELKRHILDHIRLQLDLIFPGNGIAPND
ncbi:macrolide resistance transcriptional regulator MphR(F) [Acinetobacter indicus]|uniref:macrolide resistance transcriptional regulator MphR(F) n=1 Tax=Acinetobacter indicus TaxID=756892 RepID=UPI0034D404CA